MCGFDGSLIATDMITLIIGFLTLMALVFGFYKSQEFTIGIEINTFRTPFYRIGVTSQRFILEDGSVEDEVVIGLFLLNIVFVFWKTTDNSDII